MSEPAVSVPGAPPAAELLQRGRHLRHEPALGELRGPAASLSGIQGRLLSVVPVGTGCRLAIVGYILPPGRPVHLAPPAQQPRDGLVVDTGQRRALVNGRDIGLVYREFELLAFFTARPRLAFTREHLLANVWGTAYEGSSRTVDVHIHRLRRKLGPEYAQRLVTMRHLGYVYQPPPDG